MSRAGNDEHVALVFCIHNVRRNNLSCFFVNVCGFNSGSATSLNLILNQIGTLAVSVFHHNQNLFLTRFLRAAARNDSHSDHRIIAFQLDSANSGCNTTHWAHTLFLESNRLSTGSNEHHLILARGWAYPLQIVSVSEFDRNKTGLANRVVLGQIRFLYRPLVCHHEKILRVREFIHGKRRRHRFTRRELEEIHECLTLCDARGLWHVVSFQLKHTTATCEEQ